MALKDRTNIDRSRLEITPIGEQPAHPPLPLVQTDSISPFMSSSLPPRAATLDQYARQFYGRKVPQRRILQPNIF